MRPMHPESTHDPEPTRGLLSSIEHCGVHVMVLPKRNVLDSFVVDPLEREMCRFIEHIEEPRLVIDFGGVQHVSSAALGMLVTAKAAADARGGRICLANVHETVREVFRIGKLDKIFPIYDTTDAAVATLA